MKEEACNKQKANTHKIPKTFRQKNPINSVSRLLPFFLLFGRRRGRRRRFLLRRQLRPDIRGLRPGQASDGLLLQRVRDRGAGQNGAGGAGKGCCHYY